MIVSRKRLMLVPVALLCGVLMFAIGYSFRPSGVSAQQERATTLPLSHHEQSVPASFVERHTGVILSKDGALLVLADNGSSAWYQLDDQQKASRFLGKKVVVFGRLDRSTDVIHVWNIREIKT